MSYWRVVICWFSRFVKLSTKQAQTRGHHFCCDRDTISLAANPGMNLDADTWRLASRPWLSLCFFRIFGPVGAGVYQCLLWAAMPITELCTRGWGIEIQWPSARMGVFLDVLQVNEGERSVVSMRDIGRAARVFKWLLDGDANRCPF